MIMMNVVMMKVAVMMMILVTVMQRCRDAKSGRLDGRYICGDNFWIMQLVESTLSGNQSLHYRLRPIESVQFRLDNFAPHFEGKCHFHFLLEILVR